MTLQKMNPDPSWDINELYVSNRNVPEPNTELYGMFIKYPELPKLVLTRTFLF